MATKADPMGALDKEVQAKLAAKWSQEKADEARAWIESLTGKAFSGPDKDGWVASLKDGELLCTLINTIKPGSAKYKASAQAFTQRENITQYLDGCRKLGMKDVDLFVTQDLYEGDNLVQVIDQIHALGALSKTIEGFAGPYIGVKFATEHKRTFSPEVLAAAAMAVPLQNSGSVAVEKERGTDQIVKYGPSGEPLSPEQIRAGSAVVPLQNSGSVAVEKERGTDHIVKYGLSGEPLSADQLRAGSAVLPLQTSGSIEVTKETKTDAIVRYAVAGDPVSAEQIRAGSAAIPLHNQGGQDVEKQKAQDSITRALHS